MYIIHIALGGCLRPPPVRYGLTSDTGGHIGYVLGAAQAEAARADVARVEIVTRGFDAPRLGPDYAMPVQDVSPGLTIRRLFTANRDYLAKEALDAELPALIEAFLAMIGTGPRPDLIHAHFSDAALLADAAATRFGVPWIYTPHSLALGQRGAARPARGGARIRRETLAIRRADAIVVSSRDEAERQVAVYDADAAGRVHVVAPGATVASSGDTAKGRRLVDRFLTDPSKPLLLAIARPIPKKNLVTLVEAFGRDPDLRASANLAIVAGLRDGPESGDAQQQAVIRDLLYAIDRHDLWGHVALPKSHRPKDVPGLYALAAERGGVFVNPAIHEPFGLTLIEAATHGLPVVATDDGGPVDIVGEVGHGLLVDPCDPAAIAAACRRLLGDPALYARLSAAARKAPDLYSWARWADRVTAIARDVSAGRPRPRPVPDRLFVTDMDGTLTGDRAAARRLSAWLPGARRRGLGYVVSTGRPVNEARRVLAEWDLPTPDALIGSCGTEIWRPAGRGGWRLCPDWAALMSADWPRATLDRAIRSTGIAWQPDYEQRRWKLALCGTSEDGARLFSALSDAGLRARVIASHGRFVDVVPAASGKGRAMAFEAMRLGLTVADCIAAGDSGNDADMLAMAGRAIVPSNALPDLDGFEAPGLIRTRGAHAAGVLEALAASVTPTAVPATARLRALAAE